MKNRKVKKGNREWGRFSKNLLKKPRRGKILEKSEITKSDWFWIPAAARSAQTVFDPSEAAFLR